MHVVQVFDIHHIGCTIVAIIRVLRDLLISVAVLLVLLLGILDGVFGSRRVLLRVAQLETMNAGGLGSVFAAGTSCAALILQLSI